MAIVYRHRRLDNNNIFYVGIGKESISKGKLASHSSASIITLDQEAGIFYLTLKEVCDIFGYNRGIILIKLINITKNDTNLITV